MSKFQRHIAYIFFAVATASALVSPSALAQSSTSESIEEFKTTITIDPDASFAVTERIRYNFGENTRHGIYRTIPFSYKSRIGTYRVRLSDIAVTDERGFPENIKLSKEGNLQKIRIGDPDTLVSGERTYVISYRVRRAINFFETHDELYWNATGNEWTVPIRTAQAEVMLPKGTTARAVQTACFAGAVGNTADCAENILSGDAGRETLTFTAGPLAVGGGLTIVVGMPKGVLTPPSRISVILDTVRDNWALGVPFVVLIALIIYWFRRGRDPRGRGVLVPEYEPPESLTPAEVGTVVDEFTQGRDVSAEIISLATQGYLTITRIETKQLGVFSSVDYEFKKQKEASGLTNEFDRALLGHIFSGKYHVRLSELKGKFHDGLKRFKTDIYASVTKKGYFVENPSKVRLWFILAGVTVGVVGAISGGITENTLTSASIIASGVVLAIFSIFAPAKTPRGVETAERIQGFKRYLALAEKDRIRFHNAPEKNPERSDQLLPYAMALGVELAWAKQFEGILREPPAWYAGSAGHPFSPTSFTSDLSAFSRASAASLAASARSASSGGSGFSGGFSGGGFGGGGGGSW